MSEDRARLARLLRRTGFGTTGAAVDAAAARGYAATLDALLAPGADPGAAATPPPDLGADQARPSDPAARKAANRELKARSETLALWWLDRMVQVRAPLVERLTFTWHGHWATSVQKVRSPAMMLRQNETLRAAAGATSGCWPGSSSATRRCWSGWTGSATGRASRTRTWPAS